MSISSELTIKALGAIYLILYYLASDRHEDPQERVFKLVRSYIT